jgi:hypothetical protein
VDGGEVTDPAAIYYTMSTIAQTLAAAVSLLAVFLVFLFQSLKKPMQQRAEELAGRSDFSKEEDRSEKEALRVSEDFAGLSRLIHREVGNWSPEIRRGIKQPLLVLDDFLAFKATAGYRFTMAAATCSALIILSVLSLPFAPLLSQRPDLANATLAIAVLVFAICIALCLRVVVLALDKPSKGSGAAITTTQEAALSDATEKYRTHLLRLQQESQGSYDRTLITLSGGALGLSLTFVRLLVGPTAPTGLLIAAWLCWSLSVTAVLLSHYTSTKALTKAIGQVSAPEYDPKTLGQPFHDYTNRLNVAGGVFFLGGLVCFIFFVLPLVR